MLELHEIKGNHVGRVFPLNNTDSIVIGRHPQCDIVLDLGAVSREHAQIRRTKGGATIEDLQSRNGTFVNETQVNQARRLNHNDQVRICDTVFRLNDTIAAMQDSRLGNDPSRSIVFDESDSRSNITSRVNLADPRTGIPVKVRPEDKLSALMDISLQMAKTLRLDALLPKVLDSLFAIFPQADRGFVVLQDRNSDQLIPKAVKNRNENEEQAIRTSRTIVREVIESKQAILSADALNDSRFSSSASIIDFQIHSMMCAPLIASSGEALGVIQIDTLDQLHRFNENDLQVLAAVACQAAIAIENAELHEIAVQEETTQRELKIAHQVQMKFLPQDVPHISGYEFYNVYEPARQLGGDYFDYVPLPDGRLAIVMADVSGKGVSASLLMARLSAEARFSLLAEPTPVQAIERLNRHFCDSSWDDRFVTLLLVVLNPETHELRLVNAGHPPMLLREPGGAVRTIDPEGGGFPIGIDEEATYQEFRMTLDPGQSLLLCTDGITDAMNASEDWFGEHRLCESYSTSPHETPAAIGKHVIRNVRQFVGRHAQFDDRCLVVFGRLKDEAG